MSMQQPIPPEQNPQPPVDQTPVEPTPQAQPTPEPTQEVPAQVTPEQVQANDEAVVQAVAEGLADEEITAADIMTAVLSDSLGISPAGAQSLFQLLMSELQDEEPTEEPPVDTTPTEDVPPIEGM